MLINKLWTQTTTMQASSDWIFAVYCYR